MVDALTRTALTKEQIIGVAACAKEGMSREEASKKLKIPNGTMGYIIRRLKSKGVACNFPRAKGQAWDEALTILEDQKRDHD